MPTIGFLDLPAELRDIVYSQVIMDDKRPAKYLARTNSLTHPSSLTRVNQRVAQAFTALLLWDCAAVIISIVDLDFSHLIAWVNHHPKAIARTFFAPGGEDRDEDANRLALQIATMDSQDTDEDASILALQMARIDSRSLASEARRVFIKLTLTPNGNTVDLDQRIASLLEAWLDCFDNGRSRFALLNSAYVTGKIHWYADEALQVYRLGVNLDRPCDHRWHALDKMCEASNESFYWRSYTGRW